MEQEIIFYETGVAPFPELTHCVFTLIGLLKNNKHIRAERSVSIGEEIRTPPNPESLKYKRHPKHIPLVEIVIPAFSWDELLAWKENAKIEITKEINAQIV